MSQFLRLTFLSILFIDSIFSHPFNKFNDEPSLPKCGDSSCTKPDPNKLNIHLVPHTHDDVGWLKTVDQYFYGSNSSIQKAGVQYIIDSAVGALLKNDKRRFIYVETAFFWKWWKLQDSVMKEAVKALVANGKTFLLIDVI
jgi:lysosomal alpha-mannosidase